MTQRPQPPLPSDEDIEVCLRVLKALARLGPDTVGSVTLERGVREAWHGIKKRRRLRRTHARVTHDRELRERTSRVQADLEGRAAALEAEVEQGPLGETRTVSRCYICKVPYQEIDAHYHMLCPPCAALNHQKRRQTADLRGRRALVTGGRHKIGYQIALKLLRAGAQVTVTTRFPRDAAHRFAAAPDASSWGERLCIMGLDLRDVRAVIALAEQLAAAGPLDILINNAAQTVRRPHAWYAEVAQRELELALPEAAARWLGGAEASGLAPLTDESLNTFHALCADAGRSPHVDLVQLDAEGNPLDLRGANSWTLSLGDVEPGEMAEVLVVNTMAPFILTSRLKPALLRSPFADRYVINVSAVEGQFAFARKTWRHPHTNMAKAALNMLTRTAAADYARDGIYMDSVDTGWITEENPLLVRDRKRAVGFYPPLDIVDGAARVLDPVFQGVQGSPGFGRFLKDYKAAPW